MIMEENRVAIRDSKTFVSFWLAKRCWWEFEAWSNESLAENKIKNEIKQSLLKHKHETENSKRNESHKLVLNLSQRLDLKSSNKHVALQNLSIYYTWKNIKCMIKTINLK